MAKFHLLLRRLALAALLAALLAPAGVTQAASFSTSWPVEASPMVNWNSGVAQ